MKKFIPWIVVIFLAICLIGKNVLNKETKVETESPETETVEGSTSTEFAEPAKGLTPKQSVDFLKAAGMKEYYHSCSYENSTLTVNFIAEGIANAAVLEPSDWTIFIDSVNELSQSTHNAGQGYDVVINILYEEDPDCVLLSCRNGSVIYDFTEEYDVSLE